MMLWKVGQLERLPTASTLPVLLPSVKQSQERKGRETLSSSASYKVGPMSPTGSALPVTAWGC